MKVGEFFEKHAFKLIAVAIIALVGLAAFQVARAAGTSATITWVHPVTYTDSSALPVSEIKETVITWRRPGATTATGSVRVAAPANSTVVTGLTCGSFNFTGITIVKTNDASTETAPVLYATGVTCAPNPPTGLTAS